MDVKRFDSSDESVCKFVFDFGDAVAEAVLYKYPTYKERMVICCSTQSGCPVGCTFCGTGEYFVRSLTDDEIVSQVIECVSHAYGSGDFRSSADIEKFQIMFMSMGEPMLNFSNVEKAIRMLNKLYPTAQLLISTSGPLVDYSGLMTLAKEIDKVGLQFSVHESNDAARNKLIPFKAKLDLEDINKVGEGFFMNTGRQPYFNYCAHENNTLIKNVDELSETFDPSLWQVTVSVVCEKSESVKRSQERQIELTNGFMSLLLERGYSVRTFNPAGQDDIGGGCGQLFYVQNWMKNNPALTRKSSGRKIIELIAA